MRILRMIEKPKLWSNEWFECWQTILLLGVNSPFKGMREEVRNRLGIHLDRDILIDRLMRNSFRIKVGENEYQETFYGKPVFAIALKREWNWLWQLVHKWDMNFANHFIPKLNLGFDTLTVYPDANPETTTVDGMVIVQGVTDDGLATIRDRASGNFVADDDVTDIYLGGIGRDIDGLYTYLDRGFILFNTSSIITGSLISEATLSLRGNSKTSGATTSHAIHIAASNPASNTSLAADDFNNISRTSFANKTYSSYSTTAYNDFTLNSSGISNITLGGVSKFSTQISYDINNAAYPDTDQSTRYNCYPSDSTFGTARAPKLVVTYTIPVTFIPQIIIS